MSPDAIPLLQEIRDLVVARKADDAIRDGGIEALQEQLIELRAQHERERRRSLDEAVKRRRLEHEVRELSGRVLMLEGAGRDRQ